MLRFVIQVSDRICQISHHAILVFPEDNAVSTAKWSGGIWGTLVQLPYIPETIYFPEKSIEDRIITCGLTM